MIKLKLDEYLQRQRKRLGCKVCEFTTFNRVEPCLNCDLLIVTSYCKQLWVIVLVTSVYYFRNGFVFKVLKRIVLFTIRVIDYSNHSFIIINKLIINHVLIT